MRMIAGRRIGLLMDMLTRKGSIPFAGLLLLVASTPSAAYESDVHRGLTQWLAVKAGYLDWQAKAIAIANTRVDSGTMSTIEVSLDHACAQKNPAVARLVQERHYPSEKAVPAPPEARVVVPGGSASRRILQDTLKKAKGREAAYLGLFGSALHTLQDSWSHAGTPGVIRLPGIACDADLASAEPSGRGRSPHDWNLTHVSPSEAIAMAEATYQALVDFPPVNGQIRHPEAWDALKPHVREFAMARTKTDKRAWFNRRGVEDTGFLEGVSLPDGPTPGELVSTDRDLPPLQQSESLQHGVPEDAKAFFDELFRRWLGSESVEDVARDLMKARAAPASDGRTLVPAELVQQLTAKMKIWKVRDHGSVRHLAHLHGAFSARHIKEVEKITGQPSAYIRPMTASQALFPLAPKGKEISPLLPYILRPLPSVEPAQLRMIAIARLKHAPYDTVGFIAQRSNGAWRLSDLVGVVDQ
jgi:hypothetical protein